MPLLTDEEMGFGATEAPQLLSDEEMGFGSESQGLLTDEQMGFSEQKGGIIPAVKEFGATAGEFGRWIAPWAAEGVDYWARQLGLASQAGRKIGEAAIGDIGIKNLGGITAPRTREAIAQEIARIQGRELEPSTVPATVFPPGSVPAEVGAGLGSMAPALAATAAGVPPPVAFGATFGADAYVASGGDFWETAKAAASGAVLPSVMKMTRGASANVLGNLRKAGYGNRAVEKTVENIADQAVLNAFSSAVNAPELYQQFRDNPKEAWKALAHNAGVNLGMSLSGIIKDLKPETRSATEKLFSEKLLKEVRAAEPEPPIEAAKEQPAEAPPIKIISKKTFMGRDQYRVEVPPIRGETTIGGETTMMFPEGTPMKDVQAAWAERWKEYQAKPETPAVALEGAATAPGVAVKPTAALSTEAAPRAAVTQRGGMMVVLPEGEQPRTVARDVSRVATPEQWSEWQRLVAQGVDTPAKRLEINNFKNDFFGGNVPLPPETSTTGTGYAGAEQGAVGVVGDTRAEGAQTVAEGTPRGVQVAEGPRPQTEEAAQTKVGEPYAKEEGQRQETVLTPPVESSAGAPPGAAQPPTTVPGAPAEVPTSIGIKNAEMNRVRVELGLSPLQETLGKPDAELWRNTMDRIEKDPSWIDRLITEFKENPRGHTDEEALALDHRLVELKTEHAKAARDAAQAKSEGRLDDAAEANSRANIWTDKIRELSEVSKPSGTILGRALRARRFMMDEDFSITALEMRKRQANNWEPLTEAQRTEIQKTHDEYVAKTKELEAHLEEQSAKLVDAELRAARAEAEKSPQYDPRLLKMAEGAATFMDTQANAALDRIRKRHAGGQLRMDPTLGTLDIALDLADLSIYGAAKIARGVSNFAKWSDSMIRDLGETVKPHLQAIWERSQTEFERMADAHLKAVPQEKKQKIKGAMSKRDFVDQAQDSKDRIQAKVEKGEADSIFHSVQKLVRGIVGQNTKISRDELLNEVHTTLKEFIPDITLQDARDAISGRGRFAIPAQDEVSRAVRDLKAQTRLEAHILDVEAGKPMPRTGFQRDKPSDIVRNLEQKLKEWMRKFGVTVTDPESQLSSVLSGKKTYYRNRMADLRLEMKNRERIVKTKTAAATDPELQAMIEEYKRVKAEHDEIFGPREITNEQRLSIMEKAAQRQIDNLENQIKTETVFPKTKKPSTLTSSKLEAMRTRIEELKSERKWIRDRLQPKMPQELQALQLRRNQMLRKLADYQERIANGDYAPRKRKEPIDITQDEYALNLMADLEKVKRDFDKGVMLDEAARRTKLQKAYAIGKETLNIPRTVWSAYDVSAVVRQGGFLGAGHPIKAAKSLEPMFRALATEKGALIEEQRLLNRENAKNGTYAKAELYLPRLDEFRLTRQEEIMMSQFAQRIPGVKMSNRAFITYLNTLRAETFDQMVRFSNKIFSKPLTTSELKAIGNFINVATGRGNLGNFERAGEALATAFWSPRLVTSRFQLLMGQPLWRGSARTRALIAMEYAKSLSGMATMLGLGAMAGASIETDPNSSDFLKLKFGDTRIDLLGGLIQNTVLLSRFLSGKIKTGSGKELPARTIQTLGSFLRNKLTPSIGMTLDTRDILTGQKPPPGHPESIQELLTSSVTPLSFRDIADLMKEQGIPEAVAFQMLNLFGAGVQTYQENEAKTNAIKRFRAKPPPKP